MMSFPFLHARDSCPPAIRVTRWWEPQPMRRTIVREAGESEVAFCDRAQQLAHVWSMVTDMRHSLTVMVECVYATGRNFEAEDDAWAGRQMCMQLLSDRHTSEPLRRDAMRLLRELHQHTEAA